MVVLSADVFVGLVTHPGSRFADAAGPDGVLAHVEQAATDAGLTVTTMVSDRDDWTPALLPIDAAAVRASIAAELDAEQRWRAYLAGTSPWWLGPFMAVRRRWRTLRTSEDAGVRMVRRLANIELSHLRCVDAAIASDARWALVVEDDAASTDPAAFGRDLVAFISARDDAAQPDEPAQPVMATLSESFPLDRLGIAHLLTPLDAAAAPWPMLQAARPVTNTVCATLYHRDFLRRLGAALHDIPLGPVIPIDFKLNEALMTLAPAMAPGDVWVASPAPLTQRSGVPEVRL